MEQFASYYKWKCLVLEEPPLGTLKTHIPKRNRALWSPLARACLAQLYERLMAVTSVALRSLTLIYIYREQIRKEYLKSMADNVLHMHKIINNKEKSDTVGMLSNFRIFQLFVCEGLCCVF